MCNSSTTNWIRTASNSIIFHANLPITLGTLRYYFLSDQIWTHFELLTYRKCISFVLVSKTISHLNIDIAYDKSSGFELSPTWIGNVFVWKPRSLNADQASTAVGRMPLSHSQKRFAFVFGKAENTSGKILNKRVYILLI